MAERRHNSSLFISLPVFGFEQPTVQQVLQLVIITVINYLFIL